MTRSHTVMGREEHLQLPFLCRTSLVIWCRQLTLRAKGQEQGAAGISLTAHVSNMYRGGKEAGRQDKG